MLQCILGLTSGTLHRNICYMFNLNLCAAGIECLVCNCLMECGNFVRLSQLFCHRIDKVQNRQST